MAFYPFMGNIYVISEVTVASHRLPALYLVERLCMVDEGADVWSLFLVPVPTLKHCLFVTSLTPSFPNPIMVLKYRHEKWSGRFVVKPA